MLLLSYDRKKGESKTRKAEDISTVAVLPPARRSQAERTAAMRIRLMDAAMACLEEKGYANFSISDVVQRAGVTRGALFHHFASRTVLVAEAIWWRERQLFLDQRKDMLATIAAGASLEEQLRRYWGHFQRRAAVDIEFRTATRADQELAKEWKAVKERNMTDEPRFNTTPFAWATVPGDPTPELSRFIVGYFMTGMQVLEAFNTPELPEQALTKFASILELAFAAMNRAHTDEQAVTR